MVPTTSTLQNITCTITDGCALLWIPNWPTGTLQDYVDKFKYHIGLRLESTDVYLVFDRYKDMSTKDGTRKSRGTGRVHQLSASTTLPAQKIVLNVTEKKQLIAIICSDLENDKVFHQKHTTRHKLVVTGQENKPVEISNGGIVIKRSDISTSHEEADNIIVQQAIMCSKEQDTGVNFVADDADVYAFLVHHYYTENLTKAMIMESPLQDRKSTDIKATVKQLESTIVISDLLAAHAVSGCDTVAPCFGVGKATVIRVLKSKSCPLDLLGNANAPMSKVIEQATKFMAKCYGQSSCDSMTETRLTVWKNRVGKAAKMPQLCSLPPTNESFEENVKRSHLQTVIWKSALDLEPPDLDPMLYGWSKDEIAKSFVPITVPKNTSLAPKKILQLIRNSCSSDEPCRSLRCGCHHAKLPCTIFCSCNNESCQNEHTVKNDSDAV